ncbi:MAG: ribosomal-protein-alanine N-acetyltransferase [Desulforhopalus sp.]|jgi:ribosomal-protein-alanine N-acetyltransferase
MESRLWAVRGKLSQSILNPYVIEMNMFSAVVSTDRLYLEKIKESHLDDLYLLLSNKEVQKYFPSTLTREETKEFYDKIQNRYENDGYCFLAVKRKQDNIFVGICGLLKQEIENEFQMEIGYRFLNQYWGNGYATEAVKGCVQYVVENQLFESLVILSVPENTPSIKVAIRSGFTYLRKTIFHGLSHDIYGIKLTT